MQRALALARRGEGRVEPNPMVGCVLVKGNRIIAEGYHRRFGGPHAEVVALRRAGASARGATAYVTLEPCCHHGKTPPCADALIAARVRRVIAAIDDPNPRVAGGGRRALRRAGIRTDVGLLTEEAARLIAPFMTCMTRRRPYVILKWAQSIDGKIATRTGDSHWISSIESRRAAHALRARVDAVVVGIGTVLADDPDLTARLASPRRRAARVVLDSRLRTPPDSRLVRTARRVKTLIFTGDEGWSRRATRRQLESVGCEIVRVRTSPPPGGRRNIGAARRISLEAVLAELHTREMTNVLVEGGGLVLGAFMDRRLADEAVIYVAPRLIGGEGAPGPLRGLGPEKLARSPGGSGMKVKRFGPDLCYNVVF